MVFMARKRRQAVREGADVIPIDDVQKYHRTKGRLVREEDEDGCSSGEEGGRFYSKTSTLKEIVRPCCCPPNGEVRLVVQEEEKRAGQAEFLSVEQGGSSSEAEEDEDDPFKQWERDQIRKCLPESLVSQMESAEEETKRRKKAYAQYGLLGAPGAADQIKEEEMELDSAVAGAPPALDAIPLPHQGVPRGSVVSLKAGGGPKLGGGVGSSTKKPASLGDLLAKLNMGLSEAEDLIRAKEREVEKLESHLMEAETTIAGLEAAEPKHQAQFEIFQEAQAYVRDYLDCLDEKVRPHLIRTWH